MICISEFLHLALILYVNIDLYDLTCKYGNKESGLWPSHATPFQPFTGRGKGRRGCERVVISVVALAMCIHEFWGLNIERGLYLFGC